MSSCDVAQRPSVDTNFAARSYPQLKEIQNLLSILFKLLGAWFTFGAAIATIVPNETINLLIQEPFQVICVRIVDHMLIRHGIRIAKYDSVIVEVFGVLIMLF